MAQRDQKSAGQLTKRAEFLKPFMEKDADGRVIQRYDLQFRSWAHVLPLRGGEQIMQARMAAKAPAIVTIRATPEAREITSEWRLRIGGIEYDLKEHPRESQDRAFLEMLVEA
ncbi:phage head closure protein [Paracoccus sp. 11-3]|uniref:Phage head closure protein n=1 Tax=Paracoccus amoyensis TaxID=2760093 RepID=A0A926G3T8_9RHOB|nr:phage head closure protein [Paracoccus amoyensis]MBC9245158.1 phage head closure protein [Paracoccus amoyensis]